jgi:hypothetical protein
VTARGSWAGAASAALVDGVFWLAYRARRPLGEGRGVAVVVARSEDGERFTPVAEVHRRDVRRGVAGAARPGPAARRRLAALCLLRDAGTWDERGARLTAVLSEEPLVVLYDGRPTAEDNWHEVTGVARSDDGRTLEADGSSPLRSPVGDGAFRYVVAVPLPDGSTRFYFEAARPDGAHDLMTCVS